MSEVEQHLHCTRHVPAGIRDRILEIGDTFDNTSVDDMKRLCSPLLAGRERHEISAKKISRAVPMECSCWMCI